MALGVHRVCRSLPAGTHGTPGRCPPRMGGWFWVQPGGRQRYPARKALAQPALPTQQLRGRLSDGKPARRSGGKNNTGSLGIVRGNLLSRCLQTQGLPAAPTQHGPFPASPRLQSPFPGSGTLR